MFLDLLFFGAIWILFGLKAMAWTILVSIVLYSIVKAGES
jgi:hypothetical protein